jgi:uncharacterized membrane protein
MLIHFPSALYPFSFVMDLLHRLTGEPSLEGAGLYSLVAAVGISVVAMAYGMQDLLQINSESKAWRTAGIHAILNACWFITYAILLAFRIKHPDAVGNLGYLITMGLATLGLFVSNFFGAELIIRHRIGITEPKDT